MSNAPSLEVLSPKYVLKAICISTATTGVEPPLPRLPSVSCTAQLPVLPCPGPHSVLRLTSRTRHTDFWFGFINRRHQHTGVEAAEPGHLAAYSSAWARFQQCLSGGSYASTYRPCPQLLQASGWGGSLHSWELHPLTCLPLS